MEQRAKDARDRVAIQASRNQKRVATPQPYANYQTSNNQSPYQYNDYPQQYQQQFRNQCPNCGFLEGQRARYDEFEEGRYDEERHMKPRYYEDERPMKLRYHHDDERPTERFAKPQKTCQHQPL